MILVFDENFLAITTPSLGHFISAEEVGNKNGIFEYGCNHKLSDLEEDYSSSVFFLSAINEGRIERVSATAR